MIIFNDRRLKEGTELIICNDDVKYDARVKIAAYFTSNPAYPVCELAYEELNVHIKK